MLHFWFLSIGERLAPPDKGPSYRRPPRIVKLGKDLDARPARGIARAPAPATPPGLPRRPPAHAPPPECGAAGNR